jgi:dihydropteroate synthase
VIRTHDVAETRDAALIGKEFARDRIDESGEIDVEELDVTTVGDAVRHLDRLGADTETAAEAVVRTVELAGLSETERNALDVASRTTGVMLATASDPGRLLLVGTPGGYDRLRAAATGETTALDDALERLPTA